VRQRDPRRWAYLYTPTPTPTQTQLAAITGLGIAQADELLDRAGGDVHRAGDIGWKHFDIMQSII
jgi:hypothetical protein